MIQGLIAQLFTSILQKSFFYFSQGLTGKTAKEADDDRSEEDAGLN